MMGYSTLFTFVELGLTALSLIFAIIMICVQISKGNKAGVKNKYSSWNYVTAFFGYYAGLMSCISLILIPLGIFLIIGANRYCGWARVTEAELVNQKESLTKWAIFFSIANFPIGLLSLIPLSAENTIKVTTVDVGEQNTAETKQETEQKQEPKPVINKEETIAKLKSLLDEGLITEEEFESAKKEVIEGK